MTAVDTRRPGASERLARWSSTLRVGPTAAVIGAVGGGIAWLGSWNPSYWGDEAATVLSANRSFGSLVHELQNVDAVHGLYYLLMHVWIRLFGASELSTRAPSAIAVAVLISGTVVLGARLAGVRYGILAGLLIAVLPRTTFLATEARSYAMGTAIAVWITVFFVGLLRRRETRLWPWLLVGAFVGLASFLFLYLVLLVAVYGAVVLSSTHTREHLGRWVRSVAVTAVVASPIALLAYSERGQIAFLARRGYATPGNVLVSQWFGDLKVGSSVIVSVIGWGLIVLGVVTVLRRTARGHPDAVLENRSSDRDVLRLGLAWLILPTTALLLGNQFSPLYNVRYLSFSSPAVALLMALGIVAAARLVARRVGRRRPGPGLRRRVTTATAAAALIAFAVAALPGFVAQRGDYAKNSGSDWRQVADYIQATASKGDAIVFDTSTKPSQRPELAWRLYPAQFTTVDAPQVTTPYYALGGLWDTVLPVSDVQQELQASPTVWALELPVGRSTPADISELTDLGYRVVDIHLVHRIEIYELQRAAS